MEGLLCRGATYSIVCDVQARGGGGTAERLHASGRTSTLECGASTSSTHASASMKQQG
jgi:hypothetical protein